MLDEEKTYVYTVGPGELSSNAHLGDFLAVLRIGAGLTKPKVAEALEVTDEYIRLIEKGKRTPALGFAVKMLNLYGTQYTQDDSTLIVGNTTIKFISQIKSARGEAKLSNSNRNYMLGQIVRLLVTADEDTLTDIHARLTRGY